MSKTKYIWWYPHERIKNIIAIICSLLCGLLVSIITYCIFEKYYVFLNPFLISIIAFIIGSIIPYFLLFLPEMGGIRLEENEDIEI